MIVLKWAYCELPTRFQTLNREFVDMMRRNLAQSLYDGWLFKLGVIAKNVSAFAENVSAALCIFWRPRRQSRLSRIIYCFISLKPASTVFPPNCHSNSRFGVAKSLWEYCSTTTLVYYNNHDI
jgi:hypothetical protein